jgi:NhaP-type Na+/H+ or K+/H+ antiporter
MPQVFRRVGGAAVRLLLIPGLTEAVVDGLLAKPILGLPLLWGFTLGFILKAVG